MIDYLKQKISLRFIKFLCVGSINTLLNYFVFFVLLKLGIDYRISGAIGFLSGAVCGFFLNRKITFNSTVNINKGLIKYLLVQVFCLGVHITVITIAAEIFNSPKELSQVFGIAVTTFLNYFMIKKLVFKEKK